MKWFVMLRNQTNEIPIPLVTLEDEVALFNSEEEARQAGVRNPIGEAFGFEVYEF